MFRRRETTEKLQKRIQGLTFPSSLEQMYSKILKFHFEKGFSNVKEQSGFRVSCIDKNFSIRQLTDKQLAFSKETLLVFMILRNMYDRDISK